MNTSATPSGADVPGVRPLQRGDHIRVAWPGRPHHDGIYIGDGLVIHMASDPGGGKASAHVQITTLAAFAAGRPVTVRLYAGNRDPDAIVARAMSRLGDSGYNLISNNCQHFARWCATGDHISEQVEVGAAAAGTIGTPAVGASIGVSVVGSAGLVSGLSGPGIMSGLARWGAVTGGGAVAGLVLLGALPGLASVAIMTTALREDGNLPQVERAARTAGRVGSVAGLVAGSIASIAAVNAAGVPGLSGAGISSGLAGIGRVFGGGMTRGVMCTVALPAVAAAVVAYALYRLVLWQEGKSEPEASAPGL